MADGQVDVGYPTRVRGCPGAAPLGLSGPNEVEDMERGELLHEEGER